MFMQDVVTAAQTKSAELQNQIDLLNQQVVALTQQRDLHNAAAASLLAIADEQRAALDNLIKEGGNA